MARSRSASRSTTTAFLPPSSRLTRFRRRPARCAIALPVTELPVNEMTLTSGLSTIALPTASPEPVTRLTTPGGKPASSMSSTSRVAHSGASELGLNTTVFPATSAGIIFQHGIAIGKFQGVTMPAIPSGWRIDIAHLSGSSLGTVSPNSRRPSPAMRNAMSMPSWTSPRASASTLPISRVIACASRSLCSAMSAPKRYRISPRFGAGVAFQPGVAISAARIAIATSAGVPGLEPPDDLARVGGVDGLERLPGHAAHPATRDEQLVGGRLGGDLGHRVAPRACGACGGCDVAAILRARRTAVKPVGRRVP